MKDYDLKELVAELKEKGLDMAEDGAMHVIDAVEAWIAKSALKSENKYDDMVVGLSAPLFKYIREKADEIDGELG